MLDLVDWDSDWVLLPLALVIFIVLKYLRSWYKKYLKKISQEDDMIYDPDEDEDKVSLLARERRLNHERRKVFKNL
jgi:hypothetical protein